MKPQKPDLPSNLIKIRICADGEKVKEDCDQLLHALKGHGFILEERSEPYACRPPSLGARSLGRYKRPGSHRKQLESRIYLIFSREN